MSGEGLYTRCDLKNAHCLLPRGRDICTQQTACMALELSRLSYDMEVAPWLNAGWEDVSFLVDDLVITGLHGRDSKAYKTCLQAAAKARGRMEKLDPISQIRGFRRQREDLDACKAVVMAHEVEFGPTVIAIAFTGTTKRLYEWLGNLRMEEENGFHAGFLRLTQLFEENAACIEFPCAARKTGFTRLSLQDILQHLRMGSDRFQLFVTGHSQGAALMQIYIHRLLTSGVPKERVLGVGFASPCVTDERTVAMAADYPIRHFLNADDAVARVGGRMHIGMCSVLPSSAAFRRACYGPKADMPEMRDTLAFLHTLRDTEAALLFGMALMDSLQALPESISEDVFLTAARFVVPDAFAQRIAGYARRVAQAVSRRLKAKCERVVGQVNAAKMQTIHSGLETLFARYGAKETMMLIAEALLRPHALAERDNPRAYQQMVTAYMQSLSASLWIENDMPVWDMQYEGIRRKRRRRKYDRFHPLSAQRREKRT